MGFSAKHGKKEIIQWVNDDKDSISSILDIGPGQGTYFDLLSSMKQFSWEGIEAWKPYIEKFQLEKKYNTEIKDFYVLAPFSVFDLKDINKDPLLFAKIGEDKFYLIHKWGNDLNFGRSVLNFPFRSIYHFFVSNLVLAFVFSMSFPLSILNVAPENEGMMRLWFCTHCLIAFFSFFLFMGSLTFKGFSSNTWNSKYYNGN